MAGTAGLHLPTNRRSDWPAASASCARGDRVTAVFRLNSSHSIRRAALVATLFTAFAAQAQPAAEPARWPTKPVRILVGFSAGGPTDTIARAFAEQATKAFGQTFVVENKPGADTILAAQAVAKAAPDGYTLLMTATNHTMIPALYAGKIDFDVVRSFAPVCTLASSPTVLVVGKSMPVKTLAAFLQQVRQAPGKYTYATPGIGSSGHFASVQFTRMTSTSMTHIPYKGAAQAVNDLIGGQVDSSFATLGSVLPQIRAGSLTALAVAAPQRSALLPEVPTFEESGVKGYSADAWYGLLAPAGTPGAVLAALQQAASQFAQSPAALSKFHALGIQGQSLCGPAFGSLLESDTRTYGQLARELKLKAE
ncbi:MAG: tripartite tricarboxylate transporter substrate binding protein [Burkholderiales bacterium]|nr:tripartite tricarboxylate transporter substrate binding protein [Burkholderiales bacterium]